MKTFKQALERIGQKSWGYDFEQMVEQLKREIQQNEIQSKNNTQHTPEVLCDI